MKDIEQLAKEMRERALEKPEPFGVLIVKPNRVGVTSVGKWWGILPLDQIASIIHELEKLRAQKTE